MNRRKFSQNLAGAALLSTVPASAAEPGVWTPAVAQRFVKLALAGTSREYPHKLDHVMRDAADVQGPRALHPAFYGCFDWHSAVHGHWLLARVRRAFPEMAESRAALDRLEEALKPEHIRVETDYLQRALTGSFERTYGWAWLLKLHEELLRGTDDASRRLATQLEPLAAAFVQRYLAFLPKATYPIRHGVHPNSAFGIMFAWDYATATGHTALQNLCKERALTWFLKDPATPAHWEPSGEDFFSPALLEAEMMRRVLSASDFTAWFITFLPHTESSEPASLFTPATVSDRSDPKIVHLDGLNLSRAWCMQNIAAGLLPAHPARTALDASARRHLDAALPHVTSGDYAGEHWLATFAVLALTREGAPA